MWVQPRAGHGHPHRGVAPWRKRTSAETDRKAVEQEQGTQGDLARETERFASDPLGAYRGMLALLARDPSGFARAAIEIIGSGQKSPGARRLMQTLIDEGVLLRVLCDTENFTIPAAVELLKLAHRFDPVLDAKLLRRMIAFLKDMDRDAGAQLARHVLSIYDEAGFGSRLSSLLVQLLRTEDSRVRSKVALLVARSNSQITWPLEDTDPRVRANAVEALWRVDSAVAKKRLWDALHDTNNRVVGNAVYGLWLLGERAAPDYIRMMAGEENPHFRATGAWLMGQTGDRRFYDDLDRLCVDESATVRDAAIRALTRLPERFVPIESPEPEATVEKGATEFDSLLAGEDPLLPEAPPKPETDTGEPDRGTYVPIRGLSLNF